MKNILRIDPTAKVLIISSVELKDVIDITLNLDVKDYIKKLFDGYEIVYVLNELLNYLKKI